MILAEIWGLRNTLWSINTSRNVEDILRQEYQLQPTPLHSEIVQFRFQMHLPDPKQQVSNTFLGRLSDIKLITLFDPPTTCASPRDK